MPRQQPPRGGRRQPRPQGDRRQRPAAPTSWDPLAAWYDGWVGEGGSEYHRQVAVPAVLRLLTPQKNERVLDIGCGQGVLAGPIATAGATYIGVDASPRLIALARKRHAGQGQFIVGDARRLQELPPIDEGKFDAAIFLLSLQDMDPLEPVIASASRALRPGGRVVLLLTHPAFRIPRQSGWGWDENRKLVFRRIDRYLTPLPVPMKPLPGREAATTRSFHRPIEAYVNTLSRFDLLIDKMEEIPAQKLAGGGRSTRAETLARQEIPLFLALRARKVAT